MKKFSPETFAKSLGLPASNTSVSNPDIPHELYFDLWTTDRDRHEDRKLGLTHGSMFCTGYRSPDDYLSSGPGNKSDRRTTAKTLTLLKFVPEGVECSDKIVYVVFDETYNMEDSEDSEDGAIAHESDFISFVILRTRDDARRYVAATKKRMIGHPYKSVFCIAKYCLQGT
jgi:hypothetical protein